MEFLTHPVLAVIFLLGLLIFVHEFGHFIVGRLCGIAVEIFSIGFGPPIFRIKRGETDYRIAWIPLGGFVKFYGTLRSEEVPRAIKGKEFHNAPLFNKALTIAAGPFANFLLAVIAYCLLGMSGIPHPKPIIGEIMEKSPAQTAGFKFLDEIIAIDGQTIKTWDELQAIIMDSKDKKLRVTVKREDSTVDLELTPEPFEGIDLNGNPIVRGRAGVARGQLPAMVSVTDKNSAAYKSGLKTGDEIIKIIYPDKVIPINYWRSFLLELEKAVGRGLESLTLEVKDKITNKTGTIVLSLKTIQQKLNTTQPLYIDQGKKLVWALGMIDSQLTIESAQQPVENLLQPKDRLLAMNGNTIIDIFGLNDVLTKNKNSKAVFSIQRDFNTIDLEIPLKPIEVQKPSGKDTVYMLPVSFMAEPVQPEMWVEKYDNPLLALFFGFKETIKQSALLTVTIGKLFVGEVPLKALGGPILIAKVAGDSAKAGLNAFMTTMALISINLALLNLFPIPVLDGGQLLIVLAEFIRRKPLSEVAIENYQKIGFVMVMALVVLATYNDFSRFWSSMLRTVAEFF